MNLFEIGQLSSDLLPGWNEEWVLPIQDTFRLLRVQALEAACRTMAISGKHALATQAGQAALAAEPLRESAAAALIDAYLKEFNRDRARQCYKSFAKRLQDELGVAPQPALQARLAAFGLALKEQT